MCLIYIKVRSGIHQTVEFHSCVVIHATTSLQLNMQGSIKINFSLVCYCSYRDETILNIKIQSERYAIDSLFKVQLNSELSMEFPIPNCLPFLL